MWHECSWFTFSPTLPGGAKENERKRLVSWRHLEGESINFPARSLKARSARFFCGLTLALHVLQAQWREPGNADYSPQVDVQLNTAPLHVEGTRWSLAQWNVASEIKIPAYRSALRLSLSSTLQPLDFYMYFYIKRILVLLSSVVVYNFFVSFLTPQSMPKRISSTGEWKTLNRQVKRDLVWNKATAIFIYTGFSKYGSLNVTRNIVKYLVTI